MVDKEAKSRDLQSFAEERSINNEASSRPLSQRRNPPRLMSASSKSRKTTNSRVGEGSVQKMKSSLFTLKDLRKAKLEEREDNLPTLQFDKVKWIPIISAYDPGRLKNITVKKESFEEFFGKHNPNQDPLGQLYIQSVIEHFKQWQQKINRKYSRILDEFITSNGFTNWEAIEGELDSIEKMTFEMKDILKAILRKYENHRIRKLIEAYERALDKSSEILAIINIVYESKFKIESILTKLEGKKDLKKILKNLKNEKIEETKEVFKNHSPNKYQDEILQKVAEAIGEMANMTVDAIDKLESMKHIVDRIQQILRNKDENIGMKGLDKINQIFESVLDQARIFKQSSNAIAENNFFNQDFKNKAAYYEQEMQSKKGLVIEYIFGIVDSILASMVQTFQQYYSINEPLQRKAESFSHLKSGLKNLAKNLVKEQLPQGRLILKFVQNIAENLDALKSHTQELTNLQRSAQSGVCFDSKEYLNIIKSTATLITSYKRNIKQLIRKFASMRAELHSRQNASEVFSKANSSQVMNQQPPESDFQTDYISNIYRLCTFFSNIKLESLPAFGETKVNFKDMTATKKDLESAHGELKRIVDKYKEFKTLARNNEIKDITGDIKIGSKLLQNVEELVKLMETGEQVQEKNVEGKIKECREIVNKISKEAQEVQRIYEKIVLVKLSKILKPQAIDANTKQIEKMIEEGKDCSKDVENHSARLNFINGISENLAPTDSVIRNHLDSLSQEYSHLISIYQTKQSLDFANNLYYPNSQFISSFTSALFTWLFINRTQNTHKLEKQLQQKKNIMRMQRNKLNQLKNSKVYTEVKVVKQQVDHFIEESQQLEETFKKIANVIDRGNRQQISEKYAEFLNDCLGFLTETKQLFFCLISGKNEPVYLSQLHQADCFGLISRFLSCVNLPFTKQWLSRLKNDWKIDNYVVKKPQKQKEKVSNSKAPSAKKAQQPAELIQVQPGDQIIDDMDIGQDMPAEDMAQEIQDGMPEDVIQDVAEDVAEEDIPAGQQIQEIEDQVSVKQHPKKAPPSASSKKAAAAPSPNKSEKSSSVAQKEQPKRPRKPQYVKMGKIESIKALTNSLVIYEGLEEAYKKEIDPAVYENLLNNIYIEKVLHKNGKFNELSVITPCRQNVKKAKKIIEQKLKNNILKDFICMESKYKKVTNTLKEIEDKIGTDSLAEAVLYKTSQHFFDLFTALDLKAFIIRDIKTHIIYLTRESDLRNHYLKACFSKFDIKFTSDELQQIGKIYLLDIEEPSTLNLVQPQQLNIFENNKVLKQIEELLAFSDWPKLYNLSNIHQMILSLWDNAEKADLVINEVHNKNKQKIDPIKASFGKFALRFNEELNNKIKNLESKINKAQKDLEVKGGDVQLKKIDSDIRRIIGCELLKGKAFNLCEDTQTGLYFMLSESIPQPLVKRLIASLFPLTLDQRFMSLVQPKQQKANIFYYSLPDIISSVTKIIEKDEEEETSEFSKIYNIINNQMFNSSKENFNSCKKVYEKNANTLEELLKCKILTNKRLTPLLSTATKKLKQKKIVLGFLQNIGTVNSWQQYNKVANKLQEAQLPIKVPYALVYSSEGALVRIFNGQDSKEVEKKVCNFLGKSTQDVRIKQQNTANGGKKFTVPKHTIRFQFNQDLKKAKQYIGNNLTSKITSGDHQLYNGPLQPIVDVQYIFPHLQEVVVEVLNDKQSISKETFKDIGPADRLVSQKAEKAIKMQVNMKMEEEEQERQRKEEEQRKKREEQQRKRRQQEERIRREQEQKRRKEQQQKRKKQQEEKRKKEQQERKIKEEEERKVREEQESRLKEELKRIQTQQEQKKVQKQQEVKDLILEQQILGTEEKQQKIQALSQVKAITKDEETKKVAAVAPRLRPPSKRNKQAMKIEAQKSRQKAQKDAKFKQLQRQLLSKDIMLKTPEQVQYEREQEDEPSQLAEFQLYEQSMTPSQGYEHNEVHGDNLVQVNFLQIIKDKAGQQKFNRIKKKIEAQSNTDE